MTKSGTAPATSRRPLSDVARHVIAPVGITSTSWPKVRDTCRRLGWGFDGWQDGAGRLILARRADGTYAGDTIVLSIPRQVGKTYLIACIIFALCLITPGLKVIWTAHRKSTSAETFRQFDGMSQRPKVAPHILQVLRGKGDESIKFKNGSTIEFGARESGFGRGRTDVDVLVFDEGQILPESTLEDMGATQNVAKDPLTFVMGTPPRPKDDGEFFSLLREEALSGDSDGTLYIEMSADRGCDPMDRAQWRKANASYPHRTSERAMLRLRKKLRSDDSWNREALGIWDESGVKIIPPSRWDARTDEIGPEPGMRPDSFGVAHHDGQFSVVACWVDDIDRFVEEVFAHPRLDLVADWIVARAGARAPVLVPNYGAAAPLQPMLRAKRVNAKSATTGDTGRGCELLVEGVDAGWLSHADQKQLADSVAGARKKVGRDGAAWLFDLKTSTLNAPVMATTLALAGATNTRPRRTGERRATV
ncbi:terminase large subunit domain-containing protein [Williamsia serinedens]|uniref:Terminase-like family n=1 Tax=Williamsia serinedens TaxID=391736 RepID=A0ABT1H7S1_9NOCA|nr:terminase family protein [Williamsia serinedens]MCP2162670.1 Terminase-like family [Williamsia serinedens]